MPQNGQYHDEPTSRNPFKRDSKAKYYLLYLVSSSSVMLFLRNSFKVQVFSSHLMSPSLEQKYSETWTSSLDSEQQRIGSNAF